MTDNEEFIPIIDEKELQEGKMKPIRAQGIPVLVIKQNGKVYVIDDRCPHMGCRFSGGALDGDMVVCPCHDWRFSLETGECSEHTDYFLKTYPFKVEGGKIWVNLQEDD